MTNKAHDVTRLDDRTRSSKDTDLDPSARSDSWLRVALLLTITLALVARAAQLREPGAVEWADGASYAEVAQYIANGEGIRNWRGVHTLWPPLYPVLAAAGSRVVGDVETAARLVSFCAGVFLILFAYLIATRLFGPVSGAFTALLVALQPEVSRASLAVLTASTYAAVVLGAFWVWLMAFGSLSLRRLLLTGLLLGAAYLLRPEALGFAALFPFLLLVRHRGEPSSRRRALTGGGVLIAGVMLFVVPYAAFLKTHTGQWALSGKSAYVLTLGDRRMGETLEERHYLLGPDGETMGLARGSTGDLIRERLSNPVYYGKQYVRNLLQQYRGLLGTQLHPLLMLLIGVGVARGRWREHRWEKLALVLALYGFFVYPANFIHRRYLVPLLPFMLVWAGHGAAVGWRALRGWADSRGRAARALPGLGVAGLVLGLGVGYYVWFVERPYWVGREQRIAGEWIRQDFGPGARIMERSHVAAFYARGYWLEVPYAPLGDLLDYARRQRADYLAVSPGEGHPEVQSLIEPGGAPPGICLVHRVDPAPAIDVRTSIYLFRLEPCPRASQEGSRSTSGLRRGPRARIRQPASRSEESRAAIRA